MLPQTILDGESLILTCRVRAPDNAQVQWFFGEKPLPDGPDFKQTYAAGIATLAIGEVFPDDEGVYRCIVKSGGGQAETTAHVSIKG